MAVGQFLVSPLFFALSRGLIVPGLLALNRL